jgi:hypothetical protein
MTVVGITLAAAMCLVLKERQVRQNDGAQNNERAEGLDSKVSDVCHTQPPTAFHHSVTVIL